MPILSEHNLESFSISDTLTQILVNITDEFVCDMKTKIKANKKCDGVYDCPGEDERRFLCEHFERFNQSKFESSDGAARIPQDKT